MKPRICIAGNREWQDRQWAKLGILYGLEWFGLGASFTLITGGCRGADNLAKGIVQGWDGVTVEKTYMPNWNKYGKAAGPIRNAQMCKVSDFVFLLWIGYSKGTNDMFQHCKNKWGEEGVHDHVFHWGLH